MSFDVERYPLSWPTGQARTASHRRRDAAFKVEFARARDEMLHGITLLGGRQTVLSSNIPLRRDGLPYAGYSEPVDPGVAVYFDRCAFERGEGPRLDWKPFVIACDSYTRVRWNLRAIGVTIEALRSIQRHGASSMLEQAFTGFASLPAKRDGEPPWWETLGVVEDASSKVVRDAYLELVRIHHPDVGGSDEAMVRVNKAWQVFVHVAESGE